MKDDLLFNNLVMLNGFQEILDSVSDGIVIENNDKVVFCNKFFEQIIEFDKEDILNRPLSDGFKDDELITVISNKAYNEEKEIKIGNRNFYCTRSSIHTDESGKFSIVVFRDVTNKINLSSQIEKLKKNIEMIDELCNNVYYGMTLVDDEGKIIKWNYETLLGIKEEDALGKYAQDIIENTRLHIVAKTGEKEIYDVQKVNGYNMITSRVPIIKDDRVIGVVGTVNFKDIKELKNLTNRLEVLENTVHRYKREINKHYTTKYTFDDIITQDKQMMHIKDITKKAADRHSTVLIQGESGTGKELFAHSIHNASLRKYGAFVTINCAAIPKELLESELFGYEEGAFTGAKKHGKMGKFELANGGSILLDEIGSMPIEMQAKLLRVLEAREYERVGGTNRIKLDVRIIASTNEDLEEHIKIGKFRQDLYYRLNVIKVKIPPLRERIDDITLLTYNILEKLSRDLSIDFTGIAQETINLLKQYNWPGNVRELRNAIERAMNIAQGDIIYPEHLPDFLLQKVKFDRSQISDGRLLRNIVAKAEAEAIIKALEECNGNRTLASKALGIHRTALYKKMESYQINI